LIRCPRKGAQKKWGKRQKKGARNAPDFQNWHYTVNKYPDFGDKNAVLQNIEIPIYHPFYFVYRSSLHDIRLDVRKHDDPVRDIDFSGERGSVGDEGCRKD
jgi:hypothetical protein